MSESQDLSAAIEKLERQRPVLGDATVDAAVSGLRARLASLREEGPEAGDEAERKHVTILFVDLVGFTPLSARLDPEELRALSNKCFDRLGDVVNRFGGYIDKFVGDEMMVLFGAPIAMEDHASRALYASIGMQEALREFNHEQAALKAETLELHCGINSGVVVAGGAGTESRREYTVIGEAVNVAARLVARATPGEILVGEATVRLLGQGFDLEDKGLVALKGIPNQTRVYKLADARESEYSLRPRRFLVDMVGRAAELRELEASLEATLAARAPRCLSIVGPAGVGKSRLYEEFRARAVARHPNLVVLYGAAFPHMASTPYFILGDLVRRWAGVGDVDSEMVDRESLRSRLSERGVGDSHIIDALAQILGLGTGDDALAGLEPDERKRQVFAGVRAFMQKVTSGGPVLLVCEDLHWADELSIELMEHLFFNLEGCPLFFVMMTRPILDTTSLVLQVEARLPPDLYKRLVLTELDERSCGDLVRALVPSLAGSPEVVEAIVQKGQGNPFFVEEIIGSLRDRGVNFELKSAVAVEHLSVPETVFGVLSERVDRLSRPQKKVLQSAAVVGRVFWPGLVQELAEIEPQPQLEALSRRELVHPLRPAEFGEGWEWMFRHVLLQEVAYDGMLKERRKLLHRKVARWLESRVGAGRRDKAPLLAHHYELGGDWVKAADWAIVAGDWAATLFAYKEAKQHYLTAAQALLRQADAPERNRQFIDTTIKLAMAANYSPTKDVMDNLEIAAGFAAGLEDKEAALSVMAEKAQWLYMTGRGQEAVGVAMQCIASGAGSQQLLVKPYAIVGRGMGMLGDWKKCREMLELSLELGTQAGLPVTSQSALGFLGVACMHLGEWEQGRGFCKQGIEWAERSGNSRLIAAAHMFAGSADSVLITQGVREHLERAITIQEQIADYSALYVSRGSLGHHYALVGNLQKAEELLRRSLALSEEMNVLLFVPVHGAYMAEVQIRLGDPAGAVATARHAVEQGIATRQAACEAEAHRALGWALYYSGGDPAEAERELRFPLEAYTRLGGVILRTQAGFELADFLELTGRPEEAAIARAEAQEAVERFRLHWLPREAPAPR